MNGKKSTALWVLIFAAVSIPLLAIALQRFNIFTPQASNNLPQRITFANGSDTTMSIGWATTGAPSIGTIQYGETESLGTTAIDVRDKRDGTTKARRSHLVTISNLLPNKVYYYRLYVGATPYPALDQAPATFRTMSAPVSTQSATVSLYGDVATTTTDAIIYAYVNTSGSYATSMPLAVVPNNDGTWLINLNGARSLTNGDYLKVSTDTQVAIITDGGNAGSVATQTAASVPVTVELMPSFSQDSINAVLQATTTPTTTVTATPSVTRKQDIPLLPIGVTTTVTGAVTPTVTTSQPSVSKADILNSFETPSMSNVTDALISIMWISSEAEAEALSYGTSSTSLTSTKKDDRDAVNITPRRLHHMTLSGLSSNTGYFFKSANSTVVRSFSTPAPIALPTTQTVISGTITNSIGDCVVRTQLKRGNTYSSVVTTLPTSGKNWAVNLAPIRNSSLNAYFAPSATDTVISNAICIASNGDIWYQAVSKTVQQATAGSTALTLVKLQ